MTGNTRRIGFTVLVYIVDPRLMAWSHVALPDVAFRAGAILAVPALLLWLVFSLLTGNWFIGATGIGSFVLVMLLRTPREERMMLDRFGDEYVSYMRRTGRYLPTFGSG